MAATARRWVVVSLALLQGSRFALAVLSPTAACYSPDGVAATGNFPCFLDQQVSACCGGGSVCLSTGLCEPTDSVGVSDVIRGTCTDKTWKSASCPQFCLSADTGGTNLISCQNVTNNDQDFCCDHTNGCCDSGIGRFRIGTEATIIATVGSSGVTISTSQPGTSSTVSSKSASLTASPKSSSPAATRSPSTSPPSASSSSSSVPLAAATSPLSSDTTGTNSTTTSSNNGAKIGIGVGVSLGVLALLGLGAFFFIRHRRHKKEAEVDAAVAVPSAYTAQQRYMTDHKAGFAPSDHGPPPPMKFPFPQGGGRQTPMAELDGATRSELDGRIPHSGPVELAD